MESKAAAWESVIAMPMCSRNITTMRCRSDSDSYSSFSILEARESIVERFPVLSGSCFTPQISLYSTDFLGGLSSGDRPRGHGRPAAEGERGAGEQRAQERLALGAQGGLGGLLPRVDHRGLSGSGGEGLWPLRL